MNVKRLDGRLLNYWVAKSAGLTLLTSSPLNHRHDPQGSLWHPDSFNPASDWSHAGSVIANDWFAIEDQLVEWFGAQWPHIPGVAADPLQWFLRAYVCTQFGDEVEDVQGLSPGGAPPSVSPQKAAGAARHAKIGWWSWWRTISW
jgi:hypothetical protein